MIRGDEYVEATLDGLTKRLDNIEYKEIKPLKDEVHELSTEQKLNAQVLNMNIETNNQLCDTMRSLEKTLILMEQSMNKSSDEVKEIGDKLDKMDNKFEEKFQDVRAKIREVDSKYTLDVGRTMTNSVRDVIERVITIILSGGFLAYLYSIIASK